MRAILIFGGLAALGAAVMFASPEVRMWWAGQVVTGLAQKASPNAGAPGGKEARSRKQAGPGGGAISVETAEAKAATASDDIQAIGDLQSDESVQITTEIAGRIAAISFKEGKAVEKGALLAKLDDALARAEVADAKARFDLAEANLGRAKALSRTGNVTEKAQDEAVSNFGVAQAALELGRVRLAKHDIIAPFGGTAGIRKVSPGAYVGIGTPIVNLEKIDVLKVDFKAPEVYLAKIAAGQTVEVTVDAVPGRSFTGEIYAIDPHVDVNGRALTIRARLPNTDGALRPGLFARIVIKGKAEREVVTVPESAIVPKGGETFVYRVEAGKAVETKVALGNRGDGAVEILEGLLPKAVVVVAGQQKLRNGAAVEVVESASAPPPSQPKARRRS